MNEKTADWVRMRFKKNKVWVALDPSGQLHIENGKLLIKYQLDQPHEYKVHQNHVRPLDSPETSMSTGPGPKTISPVKGAPNPNHQKDKTDTAVHIYTDGASSGNPGPSGIGVLLLYGSHEKEVSRYIGIATNNIAELEAIRVGLSLIKNPALPVRVYTDSSYALGLLTKGWKARKNQELVANIRKMLTAFKDILFVKVKGHSGDEGNERVDGLATDAIARKK
jgi:ribonuclease HI